MDHETAERTDAADRYLLNEFTAEERSEFEAHFFDCPVCADEVRAGAIFIDNARKIMRAEAPQRSAAAEKSGPKQSFWRAWLTLPSLAPSLVALGLIIVAGYQNLVTLPALEAPQLLSTSVIAPSARDATPVVRIDRRASRFNLNFMVDSLRVYPNYICRFTNDKGAEILTLESGPREVSSFTISFLLRPQQFPAGRYELTLRPQSDPGTIAQRYTFIID